MVCLRSIYIHLCLSYDFAGDHELQPISLPSNNLNACSGKCKLVHRAKTDKQQDMWNNVIKVGRVREKNDECKTMDNNLSSEYYWNLTNYRSILLVRQWSSTSVRYDKSINPTIFIYFNILFKSILNSNNCYIKYSKKFISRKITLFL